VGNDADRTWVCRGWCHESQECVDEKPVTIEKAGASIDEVLKDREDVRMRRG
jgi:hypothetical protein